MTLADIIKSISENGMGVVLLGYFLIKDWTQTKTIVKTLTDVENVLSILKDKLKIGSEDYE